MSQGGYACGCVARVRGARECAKVQRALGVCAVVHVVTHSFSARGMNRVGVPRRSGIIHTPTLRVDTFPQQEGSTCTYTPQSLFPLFHQPFQEEGYQGSRLHRSAQSV